LEEIWDRKFSHVAQETEPAIVMLTPESNNPVPESDNAPIKKLATPEPAEEVAPDAGEEEDIMP